MHSNRVLDFDDNSSSAMDAGMLFEAPARPNLATRVGSEDDATRTTSATTTTGLDTEDSLIPRPPPAQLTSRLGTTTSTRTNLSVPYFASDVLHGASHSDSSSQLSRTGAHRFPPPPVLAYQGGEEDACVASPQGLPCTPAGQVMKNPDHTWTTQPGDCNELTDVAADEESIPPDLRNTKNGTAAAREAVAKRGDAHERVDEDSQSQGQAETCLFSAPRNMNTPPPMVGKSKRLPSFTTSEAPQPSHQDPVERATRKTEEAEAHGGGGGEILAESPSRNSAGHFFRQLQPLAPSCVFASSSTPVTMESGMCTPAAPSTPTSTFLPVSQTPVKQRRTVHKVKTTMSGVVGGTRPVAHRGAATTPLTAAHTSTSLSQTTRRRVTPTMTPGAGQRGAAPVAPTLRMANNLTSTTTTHHHNSSGGSVSPGLASINAMNPSVDGQTAAKYSRRESIVGGSRKRSLEVASQLNAMDFNEGVDTLTPQSYAVAQQHPANNAAGGGFSVAHLLFPSSPPMTGAAGSPSCSPVTMLPGSASAAWMNPSLAHNSNSAFYDFVSSVSQPQPSNWERVSFSQGASHAGGGGYGVETSQVEQELSAFLAKRILTDFREVRELGRGSFGRVTLYEECSTHQYVAVKASMPFHDRDGQGRRFRREKTIMGMLHNLPHIVQLTAAWEDGGGASGSPQQQLFLQLEYCPGGSVAGLAEKMRERGEAWDEHELRTFMVHMAIALDAMHMRNIAHVDFKPDNVLVDAMGRYKLSDFGCSVTLDHDGRPCSLRRALCAAQTGDHAGAAAGPCASQPSPANRNGGGGEWGQDGTRPQQPPTFSPVPRFQYTPQEEEEMERNEETLYSGAVAPPTLTLAMVSDWAANNHNGDGNGGSSPNVLGAANNDFNLARELTQTSVASVDEGDCRYLCADMLNAKQFFKAGDLFSLGMSMIELMSGKPLPRNGEAFLEIRARPPRERLLSRGYSSELVDLVMRLIAPNPADRPSARDVLYFLRPTPDALMSVLGNDAALRRVCASSATSAPSAQTRYLEASLEGTQWLLRAAQESWHAASSARTLAAPRSQNSETSQVMHAMMGMTGHTTGPATAVAGGGGAAARVETCTPVMQMVPGRGYGGGPTCVGAPWLESQ